MSNVKPEDKLDGWLSFSTVSNRRVNGEIRRKSADNLIGVQKSQGRARPV